MIEDYIDHLVENTLKKENAKEIITQKISWYELQLVNKDKEIERLNNIINELEKELEDMATFKTDKYGNTRKITHVNINWLLTKIKELKGVDKE